MASRKPNRHKPVTQCKVRFQPLRQGEAAESVRATPITRGRMRIDGIPLVARGVSFHDLVQASPGADSPMVHDFSRVIQKSGHKTVHFNVSGMKDKAVRLPRLLAALGELGCAHDTRDQRLHAINVPPTVDLQAVTAMIEEWHLTWVDVG
ncbi:MAG: DUF4265 domain-containing protein [Phycisphaerae bacterium]